jgi:hypothetical protein
MQRLFIAFFSPAPRKTEFGFPVEQRYGHRAAHETAVGALRFGCVSVRHLSYSSVARRAFAHPSFRSATLLRPAHRPGSTPGMQGDAFVAILHGQKWAENKKARH